MSKPELEFVRFKTFTFKLLSLNLVQVQQSFFDFTRVLWIDFIPYFNK